MASSLALTLAGCNKAADDAGNTSAETLPALPATLPMSAAPAQAPALAPLPAAIPARTIRTVRVSDPRAAYAYADQAGYFSQSLGDGPPDYGFDYEGVRPWAWQGYDGSRVFLELVSGGYRTYYYRTGADRPYFIRDPQFAYGYAGDQLAAIYGPDGALIPYGDYGPRASYAAAYFWRAQRLFEASRDRQAISAAEWAAHRMPSWQTVNDGLRTVTVRLIGPPITQRKRRRRAATGPRRPPAVMRMRNASPPGTSRTSARRRRRARYRPVGRRPAGRRTEHGTRRLQPSQPAPPPRLSSRMTGKPRQRDAMRRDRRPPSSLSSR